MLGWMQEGYKLACAQNALPENFEANLVLQDDSLNETATLKSGLKRSD